MRASGGLKLAAGLVALSAYAGLSHYCNASPGAPRALGAGLALAPALMLLLTAAWRLGGALVLGFAAVAALLLAGGTWPLIESHASLVSLIDECTLYGALAFAFGRSLRAGATPLCTQIAERLHSPLGPQTLRYTRAITRAWTLFFAAITALILVLYRAAPQRGWSLFVNFGAPCLVALMFAAEYAVRVRTLEPRDRAGLIATLRMLLSSSR